MNQNQERRSRPAHTRYNNWRAARVVCTFLLDMVEKDRTGPEGRLLERVRERGTSGHARAAH